MKEFFVILFFSKTILLTPDPITVEKSTPVELSASVSAITTGANIQLDVTKTLQLQDKDTISSIRSVVDERFSGERIYAVLSNKINSVEFVYEGNSLISDKSVRLILNASKVPVGEEFSELKLRSTVEIENVLVYWRNYRL